MTTRQRRTPNAQRLFERGRAASARLGATSARLGLAAARSADVQRLAAVAVFLGFAGWATSKVGEDVRGMDRFAVPLGELRVSPPPNYLSAQATREVSQLALPRAEVQAFDPRLVPSLEHALSCLPWVDEVVSVRVELPDRVEFSVSTLEPIALISWRGERVAIAGDGRTFPRSYLEGFDLDGSPKLPLIKGLDMRRDGREVLGATLSFIEKLHADGVLERARVRSIDVANVGGRVDPRSSEIVLETLEGLHIDWGRMPDSGRLQISFEDKVKRLDDFLERGPAAGEVEVVALRWDQTIYRLRPPAEDPAPVAQR